MPPVRPRVSTVLDAAEVEHLKAIAQRFDVNVGWIVRQSIRITLSEDLEDTNLSFARLLGIADDDSAKTSKEI